MKNGDKTSEHLIACLEASEQARKRLEEELRRSEAYFRLLVENASDIVTVLNSDGIILYESPSVERVLGYKPEELIGKNVFEFFYPDDVPGAISDFSTVAQNPGVTRSLEFRFRHKDGSWRVLEAISKNLVDDSGAASVVVNSRDITERKRAEQKIQQQNEFLNSVLDSLAHPFYVIDADDYTIKMANPSAKMGDLSTNPTCYALTHQSSKPCGNVEHGCPLEGVKKTKKTVIVEHIHYDEDGNPRNVEVHGHPIFDTEGNIVQMIEYCLDITGRKQVEKALRETAAHWQGTFDAIEDLVMIIGKDFRVLRANEAMNKAFAGARVLGAHCYELLHGTKEPIPNCPSLQALSSGKATHCEVCEQHLDGRWFDVYAYPIKGKDGTVQQLVHVARDITERKQAEEALRESEEKWRSLVAHAPNIIMIVDRDGVIQFINRTVPGISTEEVIGSKHYDYIDPMYHDVVESVIKKVFETGESGNYEIRGAGPHGWISWYETQVGPINRNGDVVAVTLIISDITERKRAEEALRESEEKLQRMFESVVDGISVTDLKGVITEVNERVLEIHGFGSKDDVLGKSAFELIAHHERERAMVNMTRTLERESVRGIEYSLLKADGTEFLGELSASVLKDASGTPVGLIAITRDITERKRAEEALRESEERLKALIENAPDAIYVNDLMGNFIDGNRKAEELIGYSKDELIGRTFFEAGVLPEEYISKAIEGLEKNGRGESSGPDEFELIRKDGSRVFLEITSFPVARHGVVEVIGIARDITERKRAEEALRESEERHRSLAITDELTGLYNRRKFYEVLESEASRTQRYGHSFSLTMVDLDGFKKYNDSFGHSNGDSILKTFAQTLKSALRKPDTAFRYGGDEFAIVLPATDADRARKIVDRIRAKWLQAPGAEELTMETPVGFSAGIAEFPENAETADGLVFLADTALYRSKREGGYKTTLVSDLGALASDVLDRATLDQVYALAATVDARDPYTYGHSKRVAAFSEMIGRAIGLSTDELAALHAAGLLHDIGKVGVPDAILTKPDKPTKDEWKLIRQHPAEGAGIVGYVKELAALVPVILHHHEWYDGTGYPDGMKGEAIPLGARIVSLADAYDTMTTKRTYREVVSQEEALEELRRCSGTQFAPELVEVFSRAMNEAMKRDQGAVAQPV